MSKFEIHLFRGTSHLIVHSEEEAEPYLARHGYRREPDPALFPDWSKKNAPVKAVPEDDIETTPGDAVVAKPKKVAPKKKKTAKKKGR